MVSANNVDQELGWCREEYKKIGVEYAYFRHAPENNWYPHYIHNLDNLIRFGGLYPPIHVNADIRRTVLLGATWVYEGGCMAVRASDRLFRMEDLKGKKIGISKSLNTIKNDWWRIQEHMGIENMLMLNGMTMDDIELVEFPYPDDWYDKPEMLPVTMNNPSELWMRRDHKHDYAFRPLEKALLAGTVDAIYTQSKVFQHLQEATGQIEMIEDLSRYPDWHGSGRQHAGRHHLHRRDGRRAPRAGHRLHEGDDQGRALGQREQARRRRDPQPPDLLPRCRGHVPGHQGRGHGAEPQRPEHADASRSARTSCSATATSRTTSTWTSGPAPSSWRRRRRRSSRRSGSAGAGASCLRAAGSRSKARGLGRGPIPHPFLPIPSGSAEAGN